MSAGSAPGPTDGDTDVDVGGQPTWYAVHDGLREVAARTLVLCADDDILNMDTFAGPCICEPAVPRLGPGRGRIVS